MNRLEQIKKLNGILLSEMHMYRAGAVQFSDNIYEQRWLLRSLMNVRQPMKLTDEDCEQLKSCYRSCLGSAVQNNCRSIAFCCISTGDCLSELEKLKDALANCDTVVIGADAGLSTSAGFVYSGERFKKYFPDFIEKYGLSDMYSGGFYPFETPEEHWAY